MTYKEYVNSLVGLQAWLPDRIIKEHYKEWLINDFIERCVRVCAKGNKRPTGFERYYEPDRKF